LKGQMEERRDHRSVFPWQTNAFSCKWHFPLVSLAILAMWPCPWHGIGGSESKPFLRKQRWRGMDEY
jgi:hypothetical protein